MYVQLDLTADDLLQDDADCRDWRRPCGRCSPSSSPLTWSSSVPVTTLPSPGRRILAHLRRTFAGRVSVVLPAGDVEARAAGLGELDEVPDLAIVAVPAGVRGRGRRASAAPPACALRSSCRPASPSSVPTVPRSGRVLAAARRHGMRIVGPNCLGVVSTSCGLNATYTSQEFQPGGIAIASQSGGVGIAIAAEAHRRHAGLSSFVSMGDKVDVSGNDLLRLWADDDTTDVVLLYLESFGDPVRFARVARAVSQRKPVVALKSGWTAQGARRGARTLPRRRRSGDRRRPVRPHRRDAGRAHSRS